MLRECVAGSLGSLQTTSHQNVKLKLRLPEGSPAKFVKISGALQITKRATGRDAEASLGDLRFGDKRGEYTFNVNPRRRKKKANRSIQISSFNWRLLQTLAHLSSYLKTRGRPSFPGWKPLGGHWTRMIHAA